MIKNVVFDMGGVLVEWNPEKYLSELGYNEEQCQWFGKHVFHSDLWKETDRGNYTYDAVIAFLCKQYPDKVQDFKKILHEGFLDMLERKNDTSDYLKQLKQDGYQIYILSNFSREGYTYIKAKYDYFDYTDGEVISAYVGMIKPEKKIYEYLLSHYRLNPTETLFIDDLQENLDAAARAGIHTVLFRTVRDVQEKLTALGAYG